MDLLFGDGEYEESDTALDDVVEEILRLDPTGERAAKVFRSTFDQLYDGQRTGRYRVDQLFKTEKTHCGTLIEINLQREFKFQDGEKLDYSIVGHDVDCKYSHTGQWMLPPESFDELVLVTTADDRTSTWSLGVIRVAKENCGQGSNRDQKKSLSAKGRARIRWIFRDKEMPPNILLQLPPEVVDRIMYPASGQARINELFRMTINQRVTRNVIATVAQQDDYMKRVRANGGARTALRHEGFIILNGDYHEQEKLASSLGAEVPRKGECVSLRLVPSQQGQGVKIDESWWRMALPDERILLPAPKFPIR